MELVNIAYEDAEKTGSSMSFEKPLSIAGHKGKKGSESRVALVFVAFLSWIALCWVGGFGVGWGDRLNITKSLKESRNLSI